MPPHLGSDLHRLAQRHQDLIADQIQPRDHLRHGVLDLQAGIHLHEVEVATGLDQELHRSRVHVAGLTGDPDGCLSDPGPEVWVDHGGRSFLDQLLVPTLHRTVSLAEEGDVAVGVGQNLPFDVMGSFDVALEIDLGPAEI
jgi:hypothetical protein